MRYIERIYTYWFLVLLIATAGCSDELFSDDNGKITSSDTVAFTALISDGGMSAGTRASEAELDPLVLDSDSEEFPLYLHTWCHPMSDAGGEADAETAENSTRGLQVESAHKLYDVHKSFGVRSDFQDGSEFLPMQNTKRTSDKYDYWTTDKTNRWPGDETLSFNAVAPYGHLEKLETPEYGKNTITFGYTALKGDGNNDAETQVDLLMATATMNRSETKEYNYRVPLNFSHALSAVKFAIRDVLKGRVVSISIKGVKGSGKCTYTADDNSENGKFVWTEHSGNENYGQVFNYEIEKDGGFDPTDENKDIVLNDKMPAKTFMLIPQTIPDDAEIEVVIDRDEVLEGLQKRLTLRGKIKANNVTEWKPGYEYIYTISTSKDNWVYVFDAEGNEAHGKDDIYVYAPSMDGFETYANTAYFNVVSYRYKANNQNHKEILPWSAFHGGSLSYSVDNEQETEYPEANPKQKWVEPDVWIADNSSTPLSGVGSLAKERHDLDFMPHYVSTDYKGDEDMQGYTPYVGFTEDSPYDLSTFGGIRPRTTANCYIVDRGGWYAIPLAYGNSIVDGNTNSGAYTFTQSLKKFKDYKDNNITQPYIKNISSSNKAQLVWQDAYNLVENIELVNINNEYMIRFHVEPNSIQQGNAIIALTEANGTIIWSWHIWATEHWLDINTRLPHVYDSGNTSFSSFVKNYRTSMRERGDVAVTYNQHGHTFMMAPYNLGWCDPKKVLYLKRKDTMAFVQYMPDGKTPTRLTDELPIIQDGSVIDYKYANNTYYQWGRKDPMRGFFNHENSHKTVFGPNPSTIKDQGGITLGKAIQNPNVFYGNRGLSKSVYEDWLDDNYYNLWNNHPNTNSGLKDVDGYFEEIWCHKKTIYDPCPAGYMVPNVGVWRVIQKDRDGTWHGKDWSLDEFKKKINGAYIDDYNYKVWGKGNALDQEAIFFSSTGNRWWTSEWKINGIGGGDNFGRNVSYAWSNRHTTDSDGHSAYGMALGYDVDTDDKNAVEENKKVYYLGAHFIGRRAMGRPVRAIREP